MKKLLLASKYLPLALAAVVGVEHAVHAPGDQKAAVALQTIKTVADQAGAAVPEEHVAGVVEMIDGLVAVLNETGVFVKGKPKS